MVFNFANFEPYPETAYESQGGGDCLGGRRRNYTVMLCNLTVTFCQFGMKCVHPKQRKNIGLLCFVGQYLAATLHAQETRV